MNQEINLTWAERTVIACAGIEPEFITPEIALLAQIALERCYYIDRATEYMLDRLWRQR